MCRWIAYKGRNVFLEDVISKPAHSLIHQSMHAEEAKTGTNGDGFGLGWYGERPEPGIYREILPAWSDENLRAIARHVRSGLFFAHVRASTGTATSRTNCHPFVHDRWMFMHNGQIGGYPVLRRAIENLIPDALYASRLGTTDTEALFLIALAQGAGRCPVQGIADTLARIRALMTAAGIAEPLRFTAAMSNGDDLYAFRWSSDDRAPTLYVCQEGGDLLVVSEPTDRSKERWQPVPPGYALVAKAGEAPRLEPFMPAVPDSAAAAA
jgi:glutamine amidotransferase